MARRKGSATGVLTYETLASSSLSRGLKLVWLVASKVVACMQPDSIRPAARIPSFAFSDDIVHFQSKASRGAPVLSLNATIPLTPLSSKPATIPEFRCSCRAAERWLCLFYRKSGGFRLIFGQCPRGAELAPPHRPPAAAYVERRHTPVMKRLPESS